MKFISKSANLNIILRPGMQAQPLTGTPAVATIFVRFKDGLAEVEQPKLIEMMRNHPGFNQDFVAADETGTDIYSHMREGSDTKYIHEEIVHGSSVRSKVTPVIKSLPPEIKKMIQEQAASLAKQMLPDMVKAVLENVAKASSEIKKEPQSSDVRGFAEPEEVKETTPQVDVPTVMKKIKTTVKKKDESAISEVKE